MSRRRVLLAAYLVGVVVRVAFLPSKPFWRDEAWVASIVEQPLAVVANADWPRPVPIGFVALVQAVGTPFGVSPEVGYRLVPLLVGIAALPLLAQLAAGLGAAPETTAVAVWLAAGMSPLVYYSRELKSYDLDLFFAIVVPLLALRSLGRAADARQGGATTLSFAFLLATLVAVPWLTFGGVFVVAPTLAWGWLICWQRADRRTAWRWLAATTLAGVSFALALHFVLGAQSTATRVHAYWQPFLYSTEGGLRPAQIANALDRFAKLSVTYPFRGIGKIAAVLAILGLWTWPRHHRWLLAWLWVGPGLATVATALAGRYLLAEGRLLLFTVPPLLLAVAAGLTWAGSALAGRTGVRLALALTIALTIAYSGAMIARRLPPNPVYWSMYVLHEVLDDVDTLMAETVTLTAPGEPVIVSPLATKQYLYYGRGRLPQAKWCYEPCPEFPAMLDDFLAHIGPGQRGWLLMLNYEQISLAPVIEAASFAHQVRATARGAVVWELTRRAAGPPSSQPAAAL